MNTGLFIPKTGYSLLIVGARSMANEISRPEIPLTLGIPWLLVCATAIRKTGKGLTRRQFLLPWSACRAVLNVQRLPGCHYRAAF
jgi:hypothetical protein